MILHLFIADIQLNSAKSVSKQCTGLKLLIVHEDDFREYGIVTHEESGHLLFKFHQTIHIPMKKAHTDHDYIHKLHFTVFALFNQNNVSEQAVRIGSGVIHTSLQDTTITKTVILQVDHPKDKTGRLTKPTAASKNRMIKEVEGGVLGKLAVTFFYNDTAINIGDAVPFPTSGKSSNGGVQEYSFLLSRKLRSKDPDSTVTFDPTVEDRVAKDAEWYVTEQVIAGHAKASSDSMKKSPTSRNQATTNTKSSPYHDKSQANFSKESLTYSPGQKKKKSPAGKAKANVPVEPPKLRKTHMGVGYVKNAWPEPSAAATALEKKIYQLQLASEKKMKLLKEIEAQLEQSRKAQVQKNADKKVYHTDLPSGRAKLERHMNDEYERQKQEKALKIALKNREAEVKSLELQLTRLKLENALANTGTVKSSHQNNHSYSSKKSPFTTYPVNPDNSALLLTRLIQNTDKKSPLAKPATAMGNRRKSSSPMRSASVDFTAAARPSDRRSSLPSNAITSMSMPKFTKSSYLAGTVVSEQRKSSKAVIPATHLHPKKKRTSEVHNKHTNNDIIRVSVQKRKVSVDQSKRTNDTKKIISPYLDRQEPAEEERYFDEVPMEEEAFDIDYDYYYDGNQSRQQDEERRDSTGSTYYNYEEVFPDQSEFAYSNSQFRTKNNNHHFHDRHDQSPQLAQKHFHASDFVADEEGSEDTEERFVQHHHKPHVGYGYKSNSNDADASDSSVSMDEEDLEHIELSGDDEKDDFVLQSSPARSPSPSKLEVGSPQILPKRDNQYTEHDEKAVEDSAALHRNTKFNARHFSTEDKVAKDSSKNMEGLLRAASNSSSNFEDVVSPLSMNSFDRCEYTLTSDNHEETAEHLPTKSNRIVEQFEKNKLFSPPTNPPGSATKKPVIATTDLDNETSAARQRSLSFDSDKERYNELIANLSDDDTVDNHPNIQTSPHHHYFDFDHDANKTMKKENGASNSNSMNSKVFRWREDAELVDARIIPNNQEEQADTSTENAKVVTGRQSPPSTSSTDHVRNQLERNRMYNASNSNGNTVNSSHQHNSTESSTHQKIISQFEKNKRYQSSQNNTSTIPTTNTAENSSSTPHIDSSAVQEDIRSKYSEIEKSLGNIEVSMFSTNYFDKHILIS